MPDLYVVRHAQVLIDPAVPAPQWNLSEEGIAATKELAEREAWEGLVQVYHSPEPKAEQTARVIAEHAGVGMRVREDLRELEMKAGFLSPEEFQGRVAAYFQGAVDPEFEPYEEAQRRIVRAVQEIMQEANGQSVAIVTHGRILTVLYSHLLGRRLFPAEWKSIRLPDLSVLDTEMWQVKRGFLAQ